MTTPHKAMLIQARDALLSACGGRCNAEYNPCECREVAGELQAAIDAPEPEPVAWMNNKRDMTYFGHYNKDDLPLYAAAGAAPVPNGYRLVSLKALTRWRNAFAEELSAWDIDPPLHHVQTSHDELSAILAASPKEPT